MTDPTRCRVCKQPYSTARRHSGNHTCEHCSGGKPPLATDRRTSIHELCDRLLAKVDEQADADRPQWSAADFDRIRTLLVEAAAAAGVVSSAEAAELGVRF